MDRIKKALDKSKSQRRKNLSQQVQVRVLAVDVDRKRIGLSMKKG